MQEYFEEFTQKCKITGLFVKYHIFDDNAIMEEIVLDFSTDFMMNASLSIINNSIYKLEKRGIKYIFQRILNSDYEKYIKGKTTWEIIKRDKYGETEDVLMVKCDIKDARRNIGIGHGILS